MGRQNLSRGDIECRKQRRRAVPFVVVALAGQGAPVGQFQIALRPLQRLDRWLLIDAQHNGPLGRSDVEPDKNLRLTFQEKRVLAQLYLQTKRAARSRPSVGAVNDHLTMKFSSYCQIEIDHTLAELTIV